MNRVRDKQEKYVKYVIDIEANGHFCVHSTWEYDSEVAMQGL